VFNRNKLRGKLAEANMTIEALANALGINSVTLYRKMSGESDFSRSEMQIIRQTFRLSAGEMDEIFFAPELT